MKNIIARCIGWHPRCKVQKMDSSLKHLLIREAYREAQVTERAGAKLSFY